jgi:SAM-dependent methyltransferase/uncharacterized protein YbaR (Trm112 family)
MWKRLSSMLRCPTCGGGLELATFEARTVDLSADCVVLASERGLMNNEFNVAVSEGLLLCHACSTWFPITHGVPVLLSYKTGLHDQFGRSHASELTRFSSWRAPNGVTPKGEELVMKSFSSEWLAYKYDGVIWEMDYSDHETRFLSETRQQPKGSAGPFLELGCGIGITTYLAHKNFGVDAVGVDLSLAAMRAANHYATNPFLHFVQASVFSLPFASGTFSSIYSRGVLHHTNSTRNAFRCLARQCRPGGFLYVWVYGPGSIMETPLRRILFASEVVIRWVVNRTPSWVSDVALAPWALAYLLFNGYRHWRNPRIQPYNLRRAWHAARDRFTPAFAYRHDADEVRSWFREAGFENIEVVDWRAMPSADYDDYRRNTGVRGVKAHSTSTGG